MTCYSVRISLSDDQLHRAMEELGYPRIDTNNSAAIYGCDFFGTEEQFKTQINESLRQDKLQNIPVEVLPPTDTGTSGPA